jgi:hypothetical protein
MLFRLLRKEIYRKYKMKNLNKFRKTELINKLKDLQNKNKIIIDNSPNKSKLIKIVEFIIFLKS